MLPKKKLVQGYSVQPELQTVADLIDKVPLLILDIKGIEEQSVYEKPVNLFNWPTGPKYKFHVLFTSKANIFDLDKKKLWITDFGPDVRYHKRLELVRMYKASLESKIQDPQLEAFIGTTLPFRPLLSPSKPLGQKLMLLKDYCKEWKMNIFKKVKKNQLGKRWKKVKKEIGWTKPTKASVKRATETVSGKLLSAREKALLNEKKEQRVLRSYNRSQQPGSLVVLKNKKKLKNALKKYKETMNKMRQELKVKVKVKKASKKKGLEKTMENMKVKGFKMRTRSFVQGTVRDIKLPKTMKPSSSKDLMGTMVSTLQDLLQTKITEMIEKKQGMNFQRAKKVLQSVILQINNCSFNFIT